jgi:hypothetical protein
MTFIRNKNHEVSVNAIINEISFEGLINCC